MAVEPQFSKDGGYFNIDLKITSDFVREREDKFMREREREAYICKRKHS